MRLRQYKQIIAVLMIITIGFASMRHTMSSFYGRFSDTFVKHTVNLGTDSMKTKTNELPRANMDKQNYTLAKYRKPAMERPKSWSPNGLGELGVEVTLNNYPNNKKKAQLIAKYGVNVALSDKISLHRRIKDSRHKSCHERKSFDYRSLPKASVIVVFYNEPLSLLMRTIYSILHTTPGSLLEEIILVDDFSTHEHLQNTLEKEIESLQKVKLIRTQKREGLIRAKLLGVQNSTGEVVAFIDGHCECMEGWLEPLLEEIQKNPKTVAIPVTDDIDSQTFKYYYGVPTPSIGGFTWHLYFHWKSLSQEELKRIKSFAEPIKTPTMSGGLFAINKDWFITSGSYDTGMEVWGGENVEMSFRIWMCGGELKILPCSHIGHVSRAHLTYSRNTFWKNVRRVAEVWLDEYKIFFDHRLPEDQIEQSPGNVTERINLRQNLKCHDFSWYLENVHSDQYIPEDLNNYGKLTMTSTSNKRLCLDASRKGSSVILQSYSCHGYGNQFFELNSKGELRTEYIYDVCIVWLSNQFIMEDCYSKTKALNPNGIWIYYKNKLLKHKKSGKCLTLKSLSKMGAVEMKKCDEKDTSQHWSWNHVQRQEKTLTNLETKLKT